jgi:large subunit ribosomal protein L29
MLAMKDLVGLTDAELNEKEQQLRQEVFNLRFQAATGRIENPMKIRQTRRDLARVLTVRRQAAMQHKGQAS